MGGCKCTYKNCTVKSDGKTHLFHYPVFNKIRCHQWIINAQRYELLDLKVSQLKNRVICQYHFKDDNFMNCQKAKLTKDAIPTEDGPFCDSTKWNKEHNYAPGLPLITEDIENEDLPYEERVKNYSIKYADFLTNFEPELLSGTNFDSFNSVRKNNVKTKCHDQLAIQSDINVSSLKAEMDVVNPYVKVQSEKEIKVEEVIIEDNTKLGEDNSLISSKIPVIKEMSSTLYSNREDWKEPNITKSNIVNNNSISTTPYKNIKKISRVKILSEKEIKDSIKIPNNLKPISPSSIISLSRERDKSNPNNSSQQIKIVPHQINFRVNKKINNNKNQVQPSFTIPTNYQTSENIQPTNPLDVNCLKYEQPPLYTVPVNQSENYQPTTLAVLNEEYQNIEQSPSLNNNYNNMQPFYTIDTNGVKKKCLPSIALDTSEDKNLTETILNPVVINSDKVESTTNQQLSDEKHSFMKLLKDDKYTIKVEFSPTKETKSDYTPQKPITKPKELYIINNKKDVLSMVKNRLSPSRLAKIEEKRTFNKKLIDACIELEKSCQQKPSPKQKIIKLVECTSQKQKEDNPKDTHKMKTTRVSAYLSEDPKLPSAHKYTLKFLEDRLQQMENRLLGKIDQNSQKIQEMKESLKAPSEKNAVSIQTNFNSNQESHKRHLYNEISHFLSPNCRSAVYEELFINKFSLDKNIEDVNSEAKAKRKRCR